MKARNGEVISGVNGGAKAIFSKDTEGYTSKANRNWVALNK